jgi:hypothetical protein
MSADQQLQQQQQHGSFYGSDLPMSPTGSCVSSGSNGSSNAPSTSLEDGPATISEAMAAMANAANLGGLHSGYSYTAAALHHANVPQHGNSPRHQQMCGGSPRQLPGGLTNGLGRRGSGGMAYGSSPVAVGPGSLLSAGSIGSGGLVVPATIHEHLPGDKPFRQGSWDNADIADSVSDFPAHGSSNVAAAAAAADAAAAAVAAAYHARRASGSPRTGKGLLVRLFDSKGLLDEASNHFPSRSSSSGNEGTGAAAAAAAAAARQRAQGNDSRRSSLSSTEAHAPSEVLGELDCCDASVVTDIWASLLPLATSALALEAVASDGAQGLDCIAP